MTTSYFFHIYRFEPPHVSLPTFDPAGHLGKDSSFLDSSSELAALIRVKDWSATPLGPISGWPQSLRTTVSLCLASNFPINIVWGPGQTQIYNDGYRVLCGDKHPDALGMDYRVCWASAWDALAMPFESALAGKTSFLENVRMFLFRNGYLEETFFTFSLSPIRDESGGIGGLFHPVTETTANMLSERRTRAIRDLTACLAGAQTSADVPPRALETLSGFAYDFPFVALYRHDKHETGGERFVRVGVTGIAEDSVLTPATLEPSHAAVWPLRTLIDAAGVVEVPGLRAHIDGLACGAYPEAPDVGFAVPIRGPGGDMPVALLFTAASPRLPLDEASRGFIELVAAAYGAALARVASIEEERQRLEMLAAIDRAKTVFFSNVSHEFRTPLTLMLGPLDDVLEGGALASEQRELLTIAQRNAQRLLKLVNGLLDFSRMESGRTGASYHATDLVAFTAELASNFRSACERAGLRFDVDLEPLPGPLWIDRDMWEKIVLNLLSNAFKFTLQGGITVSLRAAANGAVLTVADTGVGIPEGDVAHVFERFHRVDGQAGRSVEGTGIGLALVREMVALHGGEVSVHSVVGEGTGFTVTIPYGNAHLPAEQVRGGAEALTVSGRAGQYADEALRWLPDAPDLPDLADGDAAPDAFAQPVERRGRVLLADDNADMRGYVQRVLSESGYVVDAVTNGAAALAALERGPVPDILVSDVMMPGLDGFGLLGAVRGDARLRELVVILLSARAGEEARLEGLDAGADDYIVKPFSTRELVARVDSAIRLSRVRAEGARREQALLGQIEIAESKVALRKVEAQVDSVFEQTAAGIAEADLEGRLLRVNERYCQLLGRPRDALIGHRVDEFVHPDDWPVHMQRLGALVRDGETFDLESRYVRQDGQPVWVAMAVTPVYSGERRTPSTVLAVVLDISARKAAELRLIEADRSKDEFLAMLAHELRNPLAPISAAASLISRGELDTTRLQRTSEVIGRQVRHMTALVDDLLDVSRVTRGHIVVEQAPEDLGQIVANALEQVKPVIEAHHHTLALSLCAAPVEVMGDGKRLVQVFTNLLDNAAKYTPAGGRIELTMTLADGKVVTSVHDNGIGIAPDEQARVFDLFAQAKRTSDRSQGGLGLGLALVKSLVELHDGAVRCDSAGLGHGSTFTVTLPLSPSASAKAEADAPGQADIDERAGDTDALRILVVDDNHDAADMLGMLLTLSGHRVQIHNDPLSALAGAGRFGPDVCLLDIGLPQIDGNELARRLRARSDTRDCVLIALTGYGQAQDKEQALAAGFDHHFTKPLDIEALNRVLADVPRRALAGGALHNQVAGR